MDIQMRIRTKKERERKWGKYLDDLCCSKYIRGERRVRIDEKKERKKEVERENESERKMFKQRKAGQVWQTISQSAALLTGHTMTAEKKPVRH